MTAVVHDIKYFLIHKFNIIGTKVESHDSSRKWTSDSFKLAELKCSADDTFHIMECKVVSNYDHSFEYKIQFDKHKIISGNINSFQFTHSSFDDVEKLYSLVKLSLNEYLEKLNA